MTSLTAPTGMALPEGVPHGPNCGVTAMAVITGKPFKEMWTRMGARYSGNWRGRTNIGDLMSILDQEGIKYDLRYSIPINLTTFVRTRAKPGVTYMVRTSGHFQTVKDGWVVDQGGLKPIDKHWGRKKRLTHIIEIQN